jgi:hypothetical protein
MPKGAIAYDPELSEVPGRCAWEKPDCFLVEDVTAPGGWRVDDGGRRPSKMLLVDRLRTDVGDWREVTT